MAQSQVPRQLKDFEVLGIGASRREQLLKQGDAFVLSLHPGLVSDSRRGVYEAILNETLLWLKPQKVLEVKINKTRDEFAFELLLQDFKNEFPQTTKILKADLEPFLKDYLLEFPWQGPLLSDHFRYFPVFLKRKKQDSRLYLTAQKEWLWSYLSFADFGFPEPEQGRILLNPSLQSLYTNVEVPEVRLTAGLYIYYYNYQVASVREYKLDVFEAAVVDLLQEDRKFTLDQLIEQVLIMDLDTHLPKEAWLKKLSYLKAEGIILESGARWIADQKT